MSVVCIRQMQSQWFASLGRQEHVKESIGTIKGCMTIRICVSNAKGELGINMKTDLINQIMTEVIPGGKGLNTIFNCSVEKGDTVQNTEREL